ncbi:MAG TPA: type II toxin-antitoxin system prevent-host-death family antitoxin [Chloroflexota bacterium]
MESVNVARLKASLSAYLARVKTGEEVVVTERGRPIARLSPVRLPLNDPERVRELARQGRIRLPDKQADPESWAQFWKRPRPEDPEDLTLKALLEDREEGR